MLSWPLADVRYVWSAAYLVTCLLIANVVGQYDALRPLAERRGLGPSIVLRESLVRFDVGYASVGLVVAVATLGVAWWVARGR